MEALLVSTGTVALGEAGDKTQLLALVLAARYRRHVPLLFAIFLATVANHALAAVIGQTIATAFGPQVLRWLIGVSFLAMAVWMLIPDKASAEVAAQPRHGVFLTAFLAFFLAEMGDKTQIATVALAAHYDNMLLVIVGSTLGMMCANVPVVLLGNVVARRCPLRLMHGIGALIFAVLAIVVLLGLDGLTFS